MNKKEIIQKLNKYFVDLQESNLHDERLRFKQALQNSEFSEIELKKRALELQMSKSRIANLPSEDQQKQLDAVLAKRAEVIKNCGLDLSIHYTCPLCQDSGWLNGKACSCRQKKYVELLRQNCELSNMPRFRFEDNTLATSSTRQSESLTMLYNQLNKFCDNFDTTAVRTILLMGNVGVGKTSLACAIANKLIDTFHSVLYLTAFDFGQILINKFLSKPTDTPLVYGDLLSCDLLIVDDLGTEVMYKNASLPYMLSIFDTRIRENKKTIICTNLHEDSFKARYGERAFSRLTDSHFNFPVPFITGDDLRKLP